MASLLPDLPSLLARRKRPAALHYLHLLLLFLACLLLSFATGFFLELALHPLALLLALLVALMALGAFFAFAIYLVAVLLALLAAPEAEAPAPSRCGGSFARRLETLREELYTRATNNYREYLLHRGEEHSHAYKARNDFYVKAIELTDGIAGSAVLIEEGPRTAEALRVRGIVEDLLPALCEKVEDAFAFVPGKDFVQAAEEAKESLRVMASWTTPEALAPLRATVEASMADFTSALGGYHPSPTPPPGGATRL